MSIQKTGNNKQDLLLPKILLIEDDDGISDVLQELFRMSGYSCLVKRTAADVLDLIYNYKPSLVIVDYLLPGINGGELCSQIKRNEATRHLPVIICSAYPKVMLSLGTYHCDAFISKPFDLDDLKNTIEQLLGVKGF